jgi:hypothetical protein
LLEGGLRVGELAALGVFIEAAERDVGVAVGADGGSAGDRLPQLGIDEP